MVLGLVLTGIGFLWMVGAVYDQAAHGKASMWWLVLAYLFHTMGELCISPVGLSMVTKLAPLRLASLMMGVWFLINFVANWLAGIIRLVCREPRRTDHLRRLAVTLFFFAVVLWTLSGRLVRWMHGAEDVKTA
jgi:POT family proton-dependent oligopeptide transporter